MQSEASKGVPSYSRPVRVSFTKAPAGNDPNPNDATISGAENFRLKSAIPSGPGS